MITNTMSDDSMAMLQTECSVLECRMRVCDTGLVSVSNTGLVSVSNTGLVRKSKLLSQNGLLQAILVAFNIAQPSLIHYK